MLSVVLRCGARVVPKARYVIDTLMLAAGVQVSFLEVPPQSGAYLLYADSSPDTNSDDSCLYVKHSPDAWEFFDDDGDVDDVETIDGLPVVLGKDGVRAADRHSISFDILANAFYFLSSWSERRSKAINAGRQLFSTSATVRLGVQQDVVDLYLERLIELLRGAGIPADDQGAERQTWPSGAAYAVVLSHDVDYIPQSLGDVAVQGLRTALRHLLRQYDPVDALRATTGLAKALIEGRDPYGCVPEIIRREAAMGVRSSFQVAVGHRHPSDVNYRIEDSATREYLSVIPESGVDLCLHGSYRSTENGAWYEEEVRLLTEKLGRPLGSRQHFLSFGYDALFRAQERAGIEYDMSMGYPDHVGPRAGFSYPYFPYCLDEDRPYKVLQLNLFLMDVTLRSYMRLKGDRAWQVIEAQLAALCRKGGCASVVWHPIVFGGARDPGDDALYWRLVEYVQGTGGLATDGRTINAAWRQRAAHYSSFAERLPAWHVS